jgi:hypothetical protein
MEVVERYNIYDWILVVYVHEIPYYIHQSDAIVRCVLEAASGGTPGPGTAACAVPPLCLAAPVDAVSQAGAVPPLGIAAPVRARVAVFVIMETVRQVMEPLLSVDGEAGEVVDPGRVAPVNYYRLTVRELQLDGRGVARLVEVPGDGVDAPGDSVDAAGDDVEVPGAGIGVSGEGRFEGRDGWRQALRATFPRVKAKRRMLVSFSHGAAFGINVDMEGLMRVQVCEKLPILWSDDLASELKNCLGDQPIDVLVLNNCYMQCFETGYALKDQVRFMVAAEGALGATGYDYAGLMKRLFEQPGGEHEAPGDEVDALVKGIITDYAAAIFREEQAGQAVFANRTSEYGRLLMLLERLTAILLQRMGEVIDVLVDIRENKLLYVSAPLNGYTSNYLCMIDLFAWVNMVFDRLGHLFEGDGLAAEFAVLKQRMVVAGKVGEGLVEHDAGWPEADANGRGRTTVTPIYGYSGLSIFYPRSVDWQTLRPIPRCARLVDPWKRFLGAYYARSPLAPAIKNPGPSRGPGIKC